MRSRSVSVTSAAKTTIKIGRERVFHIVGYVNPEPWSVGTAYATRTKSGAMRGGISPNKKVQAYQKALREELLSLPMVRMLEPGDAGLCLRLWFWRQIEVSNKAGRRVTGHIADVTNLQKSTEDALQGILFENDNAVRWVCSEIIEQEASTVPTIAIEVWHYREGDSRHSPHQTRMVKETRDLMIKEQESQAEEEYQARNMW